MNLARQELGADAMLVSTKRTDDDGRALGEYEVVFASTDYAGSIKAMAPHEAPQSSALTLQPIKKLSDEVAALKREMERLASALARSSAGMAKMAANPDIGAVFAKLVEADFDAAVAQDILARVISKPEVTDSATSSVLTDCVSAELMKLLKVDSRMPAPGKNTVIVVGPPGVGKTTTLVKLAVRYGLTGRRRCQILSLDTNRVAGCEQLRSYAAITGLAFQAIETPHALAQLLDEYRHKDLVLIDTPGFTRNEMEDAAEMAKLVCKLPQAEAHLVLSASMKTSDMNRLAAAFEIFAPAKLIFTRLDETETFGSLLNLSLRTGKPVSFVTNGQQVPDDLAPANQTFLAGLVAGNERMKQDPLSSTAAA
jgi:flagellar biosynthesis protein FlhF